MPMLSRILAVLLLCAGLFCLGQQSRSQTMLLLGAGKGAPGGAAYQGPGDVVSGATAWGSCARTYNAAFGAAAICDLVDTATGVSTCTLKSGANGFADLTTAVCAGNTLSVTTFCTVTHAAGCSVTKVYDQTGNANHCTNATLANMPTLTLSALNSLPGLTGNGTSMLLACANTITASQPNYTMESVFKRTGNTGVTAYIMGFSAAGVGLGSFGAANQAILLGGSNLLAAANDNVFHAMQGVPNGASSVINIDGSDTTGAGGATNLSANTLRILAANGSQWSTGTEMEFGFWTSTGFNPTQRGNVNTNIHGTNGYNF